MTGDNFITAVRFGASAVYISDADLPLFLNSSWHINCGYLKESGTGAIFHRIIMGDPDGQLIDHINGNTLDNSRRNLRVCTHAENMRNRKIHKNNMLGTKGVYLEKRTGRPSRFVAQIRVGGRKIVLGRYRTIDAADAAYKDAALRHHGEFARIN